MVPQKTKQIRNSDRVPDVMMESPRGAPVAVECKYDKQVNIAAVEKQVKTILGEETRKGRTIELAVAVLYPSALSESSLQPEEALSDAVLKYVAYATSDTGITERFPDGGWLESSLDKFAGFLETLGDPSLLADEMAEKFIQAVEAAASVLNSKFPKVAEVVKQENCEQTDQMVAALMLNAFIFHHIVAIHHSDKIDSPAQMQQRRQITQTSVGDMWQKILDINYYPIFGVAQECLEAIVDTSKATQMLQMLANAANDIAASDPYAAQSLAGEAFGALIADRKFLASFYTLPVSAHLLSELAVARLGTDWSNPEEITQLRIADFACGTGALLTAVYKRIQERARKHQLDTAKIHQQMLEDVFVGADIMPAAVHITAAALSGFHPEVDYTKTQTHVMPFGNMGGNRGVRVGSLEVLEGDHTQTLFGDGTKAVTAQGEDTHSDMHVPHGSCDLVIMNPPYTSPTNHTIEERQQMSRPDFAAFGADDEEQKKMAKRAASLSRKLEDSVRDGRAGMGTDFFDIAHAKLKPGGVAAFVLSASMPTGTGWQKLRDLLSVWYEDVCVVSISSAKMVGRGFSADTAMAEILLLATKRKERRSKDKAEELWTWISLNEQPQTNIEARAIADAVLTANQNSPSQEVTVGKTTYGHISFCERHIAPAMLRSPDVVEALIALSDSKRSGINLPRSNKFVKFNLCKLEELGTCGPVDRLIAGSSVNPNFGAFIVSDHLGGETDFPILWNHHCEKETRFIVQPDKQGRPVPEKESEASDIYKTTATRLHFNRDYDFTSQPLAACLTPELSLGGRAWPSFTLHKKNKARAENMEWVYPILLWANSTLGLMSFYITGTRNQKGRSNLTVSRLPELLVLDPRKLSPEQLKTAKEIFNRLKDKEFMQANIADYDPTRQELDKALLCELLGHSQEILDRLEIIRSQWCNEPHLYSRRRDRPGKLETSTDSSASPPAETALPLEALRGWMMNDGRLSEFLEANHDTTREQIFEHLLSELPAKVLPDCEERWWQ